LGPEARSSAHCIKAIEAFCRNYPQNTQDTVGEIRRVAARRKKSMFKIGKEFHLTHVVGDLRTVDRWYDDIFAVTRYLHGPVKVAGRNASLIAIGDLIVEPMEPLRIPNLRNQSVTRFHARFGDHLHSVAYYVDDVPAISTHLAKNNLHMWDISGTPVVPPNEKFAVWTHPKETHGQLEFAFVGPSTIDPRLQPAWSNEFWRERHPLGIERASHITAVVRDVVVARKFYCDILGAKLIHEAETAGNRRSAFVAVGEDTVVELLQPLSSNSAEAQDLEKNGEGFFGVTFKIRNLAKATEFLKSKQMKPESDGQNGVALNREQAFGMVVGFTERPLPNDPRN
jgi:catechol 2,3-dioxygenase-like lactoylglutathione lyase family enzyme